MVSSGASSDAIFNSHYRYLFSVLAPRSRQLQGVVDMALAQNPKPQSVAILFASDSLSAEVANATAAYAQAKGLTMVYWNTYPSGVNDISSQLAAAAAAGAEIILEAGHPSESVRTVQQAQQMNLQAKLLGFSDGPGGDRFTADLHKAANFAVGATQWAPAARNRISYFLDSFHYALAFASQFGHMPDQHAAAATAACLTLEVAIERAASTEPAKVREALAATDLNPFFGQIKLADLVPDRLPRPAQVAIDLAPQEVLRLMAMLEGEWQHQLRRPRLRRVVALVRGDLQSNMHADIDHDAHGAEGLGPEHAELVGGILQVAELPHQA